MDSRLGGAPSRIAYSFPQGTFDLGALCPQSAFEADDGWSTAVRLGGHLPSLFRRLEHLGVVLASAQSGPFSLADAWAEPSFQWVSHTGEFVDLHSGAEVRLAAIRSVLAVVQEVEDQQVASLQFMDAESQGGLKLLLTNGSDLDLFEALISIHARPREEAADCATRTRSGRSLPVKDQGSTAHHRAASLPAMAGLGDSTSHIAGSSQTDLVRTLWPGLTRSLPESDFPGCPGLSRREAFALAGPEFAWQVSFDAVARALENMAARHVSMGSVVRNSVVVLPATARPRHWSQCGCGQTFLGGGSQFTLRRCAPGAEAWAVRFSNETDEVTCLEFFDGAGAFAGAIGLSPEASDGDHQCWREILFGD